MHLAAIDIGTNSLHMILVRVTVDGGFEVIGREKDMVRLGAGGLEGRPLNDGAMDAALQTLARFKRLADSRSVDEIIAVATSAVREAPNGGDFLQAVQARTGIQARVITGIEEARLIHASAVHGIDVGSDKAVVIDIGGGSTEITCGTAAEIHQARSFRLGVIRLGERFAQSDPLSDADERKLVRHIQYELDHYLTDLADAGYARVIGTSGTILSIGALALGAPSDATLHHRRVSAKAIRALRKTLASQTLDERLAIEGLDPKRADLVVSGVVLLDTILRQLGADELTLCELSLREGAVLDYIRRNRTRIARIERYPDIRRRSVEELAQRCNADADHARQVARLALALFDQTADAHGLDARAREWLELAALLHDIGEHISYERHHRHSDYLIRHGGLRGFEPDEIDTLALVARYHRRGTPKKTHDTFAALPRPRRDTVRWLSAMLRLAESLDRSRAQLVESVTLARKGRQCTLRVAGRGDIELEIWAAERNAGPLASQLGQPIRVASLHHRTAHPRDRTADE